MSSTVHSSTVIQIYERYLKLKGKVNKYESPPGLGWPGGIRQKVKGLEGVLVGAIDLKGKVF